jgi:DNA gyrase subunit A
VSNETIIDQPIHESQIESMTDYGISVNIGRSIPDLRDGLKPIQRRVLVSFRDTKNTHSNRFKKGASVVGYCMSNYSPHGDGSIYDTAVRMSQDWANLVPLVDYSGNNGSIAGDAAAAQRYLELRSAKIAEEFFKDLTENTVDHIDNFDKSLKEPKYLPVTFPAILVNGTTGMGYGYSSDIPTFHPQTVYNALEYYLTTSNDNYSEDELISKLKISLPTGNIIINSSELPNAMKTGHGRIVIRCRIDRDTDSNGITSLTIKEAPYQTTVNALLEKLKEVITPEVNEKLRIASIKDLSDATGVQVVIKLKRDSNPNFVEEHLYNSMAPLQKTVKYNFNLVEEFKKNVYRLRKFSIQDFFQSWTQMRFEVINNKISERISDLLKRIHILEGLVKVCENYTGVVDLISNSADKASAVISLISTYKFSRFQAESIVEMRLASLSKDGIDRYRAEIVSKNTEINALKELINDQEKVVNLILTDAKAALEPFFKLKDNTVYSDILNQMKNDENFAVDLKEILLVVTESGFIKSTLPDEYVLQRRGGKGKTKANNIEESITDLIHIDTHTKLGMFTSLGRMFTLSAADVPPAKLGKAGVIIESLLENLKPNEKVVKVIAFYKDIKGHLLFVTNKGVGKRTNIDEFTNSNRNGIIAIELDENDSISKVILTTDVDKTILLSSSSNRVSNIVIDSIPIYGRITRGVQLSKFVNDQDYVLDVFALPDAAIPVITMCKEGYGKIVMSDEYPVVGRNVLGVDPFKRDFNLNLLRSIPINNIGELEVGKEYDISLICFTLKGKAIRINISELPVLKRPTKGNRVINLEDGDLVSSCTLICLTKD